MKLTRIAIAASAAFAAFGAHATLVTTLGGDTNPATFLSTSATGVSLTGTYELLANSDISDLKPQGTVGAFLSVEASQSATLTFSNPINYVSFLWGSPDTYNALSVTEANGTVTQLTASSFGLLATSANIDSAYVQIADLGSAIKSITLSNSPAVNSFEVANVSVTPVPEPGTYALMLGGLGVVGFIARRRRRRLRKRAGRLRSSRQEAADRIFEPDPGPGRCRRFRCRCSARRPLRCACARRSVPLLVSTVQRFEFRMGFVQASKHLVDGDHVPLRGRPERMELLPQRIVFEHGCAPGRIHGLGGSRLI